MKEIRLARKGEIARQKEIWKLCFQDSDQYIDFFYAHAYVPENTMLLLLDGEIAAMLTIMPCKLVTAERRNYNAAMLYAIATHPQYQNRGYATELMAYAHEYLKEQNRPFSVLVPAEKRLFEFYRKQGYEEGFYLQESLLTPAKIASLPIEQAKECTVLSIAAAEYNRRRNILLQGSFYIAYAEQQIAYQKALAQQTCADIYGIEIDGARGCTAIERINQDKLLIKELLLPEHLLYAAIKEISRLLPAKEYVIRTPVFLGRQLEGNARAFAMMRANGKNSLQITPKTCGYLGFAFD
ncbi:MAG: GNAT family N-acetyltransferase [bacterium]|jgi:GNAT superfamily N-acetyltransferase